MTTKCPKVFSNLKNILSSQTLAYGNVNTKQNQPLHDASATTALNGFKPGTRIYKSVSTNSLKNLVTKAHRDSTYDLFKNKRETSTTDVNSMVHSKSFSTLVPTNKIHRAFSSNQKIDCIRSKNLNERSAIAENRDLADLRNKILASVTDNPFYNRIYNEIVESLHSKASTSSMGNKRTLHRLEDKLKYNLGCIIQCLDKLTEACQQKRLGTTAHLSLLNTTILNNERGFNNFLDRNMDDMALENELLNLNEFAADQAASASSSQISPGHELLKRSFLASYALDSVLDTRGVVQNGYFTLSDRSIDDSAEFFASICTSTLILDRVADVKSSKNSAEVQSVLSTHGKMVTDPAMVEFSEDIVASVERDINQRIEELRADVGNIEKYVHEMKMVAVKDWLRAYAYQCFEYSQDDQIIDKVHFDEIE